MGKWSKIKLLVIPLIVLVVLIFSSGGAYVWWNVSSPERTCNSCHEINPSYTTWAASAHREVKCDQCHGTALSNGWHSIKEKSNMVFTHYGGTVRNEDIRLDESELLETMARCKNCHQAEYAMWKGSGHSATYSDIFLDETHNSTEQLNYDCLRCHGMFYEETVDELVQPISQKGPWDLLHAEKADQPTILCLSCHKIHSEDQPTSNPDYSDPDSIFYQRTRVNNTVGFYSRHEKMHFPLAQLPTPVMLHNGDTINTPQDPTYRLCVQCHAPSVWHQAGEGDDRTPTGVHEGISCAMCHETHSNYQANSCDKCHPKISNCNLDVKTMNTSFSSADSPNNIHSIACTDCHDKTQGS